MKDYFDLSKCILCPRECKKNRAKGEIGLCGAKDKIKAARASLHFWEEPCISGKNGSGTIFFSGCNLNCIFCQNKEISHKNTGVEIDENRLCEIFFEIYDQGAHNINLVTATHYLPQILSAIKMAKGKGLNIPFVYNSSGYERPEVLKCAKGLIDIYLPDFKYIEYERAMKYSGAKNYPEVVKSAIAEMVRQQPECVFNDDGMMRRGVIVRHLMLPEGLNESKKIVKYLYETYGNKIFLSLMSQYTPVGNLDSFPELREKVSQADYEKLVDYAVCLGVENAYIQVGEAASESFIPDFSGQGIIKEV